MQLLPTKNGRTLKTEIINQTDDAIVCKLTRPSSNPFDQTPDFYEITLEQRGILNIRKQNEYDLITVRPWQKAKIGKTIPWDLWHTMH